MSFFNTLEWIKYFSGAAEAEGEGLRLKVEKVWKKLVRRAGVAGGHSGVLVGPEVAAWLCFI